MVARLRRYTRSKMGAISEILENDARQAADLLTSLSAERDRLETELTNLNAVATETYARLREERDALKSPPDEVLERMARAYDESIGISWARMDNDRKAYAGFVAYRISSMRAALAAAEGEQASIPEGKTSA